MSESKRNMLRKKANIIGKFKDNKNNQSWVKRNL